jgi:hypothetical protein
MEKIPSMVDMKRTPAEVKTDMPCTADQPSYPYGLCLSLGQDELDKLGFAKGDLAVSDMVHLHCLASVTSVSEHDNINSGPSCRVELQITHISAVENEDTENNESEKGMSTKDKIAKLYSK